MTPQRGAAPPADPIGLERRAVNPWSWQDTFGFVHAQEVVGDGRMILCAGQASVDDEGRPLHAGDISAQIERAFDNLEVVLEAAGARLPRNPSRNRGDGRRRHLAGLTRRAVVQHRLQLHPWIVTPELMPEPERNRPAGGRGIRARASIAVLCAVKARSARTGKGDSEVIEEVHASDAREHGKEGVDGSSPSEGS